jgi:uridine kinase
VIIGLGGGTGSGKSAIVRSLVARVGGCVIDLDSYALDLPSDERAQTVEGEPAAFDVALLAAQLRELRRGESIRKPVYSPEERARTGVEVVAPARLVLVEGLFTLWWHALRALLDVKVFVDAPADLRLLRRIRRALGDRDHVDNVLQHYAGPLRATHERYVEPTRVHADVVVTNDGPLEDAVEQVLALVRRKRVDALVGAAQP